MRVVRCLCSRCNLYLKVTTDAGDLDYHSEAQLKSLCFEDRKYQTALLEYAKTHNIMACLPTGSGKTFIALKLIEHFGPVISTEGKKVFFLANTIPLVNQQAAFIHRNSSFKVRHLTGDMDVDYWSLDKWEAIVNEFNVMAMTSMIFLNMIKHGYIAFSKIALIIFDECHHAFGDHPMALIMKEYSRTKESDPSYQLPRILGLSATIIMGPCKPHEVASKIQGLESTLHSAALTYKDYEEVLSHSTSSTIERISVSENDRFVDALHVSQMEEYSKDLQVLRKKRQKERMMSAKLAPASIDSRLMNNLENLYQLQQRKATPGDLKGALDDVLHAYKDLGLYCALIAVNLRLAFIEFSLLDINDGSVKGWYIKVRDYFHKLRYEINSFMADNEVDEKKYVHRFISPKLKSLVRILEKYRPFESAPACQFGDDNRLCGLVFTDRRGTAQVLAWYLKDLAKHSKTDHGFIRANFVVGTSRSAFESVESRVYARKQMETLNKNVEKIDADLHTIKNSWQADVIPPICPGGLPDSPKITMDSAYDVVERYCNLLPSDGIATLQTMSWWSDDQHILGQYKAYLKLPLNGALKQTVEGKAMRNKESARQAVYMAASQLLLDAGCLDDRLVPCHPTIPIKIQKYFKYLVPFGEGPDEEDETPEPGELNEKTEKDEVIYRNEWYPKRIPKVLVGPPLSSRQEVYVYKVNFDLAKEREQSPWTNLYKFHNSEVGFAIITTQSIPNVGVFPLFGTFGTIHCTVTPLKLGMKNNADLKLNDRLLERLKYVQHSLFSDVLGLKHPLLRGDSESSWLITPITKVKNTWILNENIEKELKEIDAIQKMRPPRISRDQSRSRVPSRSTSSLQKSFGNSVVFPWYKRPKPAYLVDCVMEDLSPMMEFQGGTYKNFLETEYKVRIQDSNQKLLKCKLAGIALGRKERDPLQMNYLLEKFNKEDEYPIYMVPELVYSINIPATLFVQLKLLPSVLHRLSRLLLAHELLAEVSACTGWPKIQTEVIHGVAELELVSSAHEMQKKENENRRKRRVELRNEKIQSKKQKPTKPHIEERDLHYEFIHPNDITLKDINLFHEAVSVQSAAKKMTLQSAEIELVSAELSLKSKFELLNIEDIKLNPLDKPLDRDNMGPSLLTIMEALSYKLSNEGLVAERYQAIGSSFLSFATSLFAFCNFPLYGEPLLIQLRNNLLTLRVLHMFCKRKGLPKMISGSDFHPGASWIPPGKRLVLEYLGELVAESKLHLNIFDELIVNQNPRINRNKLDDMSRQQIEEFINKKASLTPGATEESSTTAPAPHSSDRRSQPNRKKPALYSFKHATFTHTELPNYEVVNKLHGLVGTFFVSNGSHGAYKALQWLNIQAPDWEGTGRDLNDFTRGFPDDVAVFERSLTANPGRELFPQFEALEELIKYQFNNKALLLQAFTHPTYPGHNLQDCYQRLEFVGDAVLDLLLTNYVYSQEPCGRSAEDLQSIRSAFVNNVTYASLAVRHGFQKHLLSMSKPLTDMIDNFVVFQESMEHHVVGHFSLVTDEECRGPKHIEVPKVLGDIWEALAGAIYIDSKSLDVVWRVFYRLMLNELDVFWETKPPSPIHSLKSLMAEDEIEIKFSGYSGASTRARGRECCRIDVGRFGKYFGMGTTYPRAKEAATKLALKLIKEETDFIKDRDATKIMLLC